ncbi:MAG: hypothetical protein M3383_08140 [Actinomycetota bacterium]|nr:hypothetical protein [Actinomycetota bacterium]
MIALLSSWFLFPLVLGLVALGAGLLSERAAGARIPGPLLLPVGLAAVIVVASFATATDATAELALPLAVVMAVAGFAMPGWRRGRRLDPWPWLAAAAVYVVYLAPVAFSGELTFAGYIKLDDTSTWFALTDRVMEHGRSIEGLPPSTYEAALSFNLAQGYPLGSFFPFGIGSTLVGQDVAWVFQPYVAFLGAALALGLHALAAPLIASSRTRAVAAFIAAQSALLLGYSLWGGVKELAAAVIVVLLAALIERLIRSGGGWRDTLPLAVATAAAVAVMSPAGALLWLGPLLLPAIIATVGRSPGRAGTKAWVAFVAATAFLTVPWLIDAGFVPPTSSSVTSETAQGNLIEPLSFLQVFGIWPTGDFRVDPVVPAVAYALIALVAVAAAYGLARAWKAGAWGLFLYGEAAILGAVISQVVASPWVAAKGLAIASPAPLIAAFVGCAVLFEAGRRLAPLAIAAGPALGAGVVWSNALAYHEVNLAPADRLAELEEIGDEIAGEGPALMTDYEPYGVRHFLRDADPEGASELRRSIVPLREGGIPCAEGRAPEPVTCVPKGSSADIDEFQLAGILPYRTLVLRRSPVASRPPALYERTWRGSYYEVWQRPADPDLSLAAHLPLGDSLNPGSAARACATVRQAVSAAGPGGRVLAVERERPLAVPLASASLPPGWLAEGALGVVPTGGGTVAVTAPTESARYTVWIGGAFRGSVEVAIDGRRVATARNELSFPEHFVELGAVSLEEGPHRVTISYDGGPGLRPGVGGRQFALGPLVLGPVGPEPRVTALPVERARELCGARLDWVEAVAGR